MLWKPMLRDAGRNAPRMPRIRKAQYAQIVVAFPWGPEGRNARETLRTHAHRYRSLLPMRNRPCFNAYQNVWRLDWMARACLLLCILSLDLDSSCGAASQGFSVTVVASWSHCQTTSGNAATCDTSTQSRSTAVCSSVTFQTMAPWVTWGQPANKGGSPSGLTLVGVSSLAVTPGVPFVLGQMSHANNVIKDSFVGSMTLTLAVTVKAPTGTTSTFTTSTVVSVIETPNTGNCSLDPAITSNDSPCPHGCPLAASWTGYEGITWTGSNAVLGTCCPYETLRANGPCSDMIVCGNIAGEVYSPGDGSYQLTIAGYSPTCSSSATMIYPKFISQEHQVNSLYLYGNLVPISPSPSPQSPSPIQRSPSPIQQSPSPIQQSPSPIQQSPSPIQQSPSPIQQSPSPVQQSPSPVLQSPSPIQQSPSPIQQSPSPIQQSPSPIQQSPSPVQQSPSPIQQSPSLIQQSPSPAQQSPSPIQQPPSPIQQSSSPVQQSPSPIQQSPSPIQQSPVQQSPSPIQQSPSPAQQSPSPIQSHEPQESPTGGNTPSPSYSPHIPTASSVPSSPPSLSASTPPDGSNSTEAEGGSGGGSSAAGAMAGGVVGGLIVGAVGALILFAIALYATVRTLRRYYARKLTKQVTLEKQGLEITNPTYLEPSQQAMNPLYLHHHDAGASTPHLFDT